MSGIFLTWLADVLRRAGCVVKEYQGWQTRARSSGGYASGRPLCVMWHHTASPASWNGQKDADYIAHGDESAPLANLYIDRQGVVWVIAAGATNTNGKGRSRTFSRGTVPADSMNSYALGIEFGNNGVGEPWPKAQIDAGFRASNAVNIAAGNKVTDVCTHQDYAPDRKIDPATAGAVQGPWRPRSINSSGSWHRDDLITECAKRAQGQPQPPPEDDVEVIELRVGGADAVFLALLSKAGGKDAILWCEWVNGNDTYQRKRLDAYRSMGTRVYSLASPANLTGIGLLGPLPTGDAKHQWVRSDFGNVIT